jgi:hypothetical protein
MLASSAASVRGVRDDVSAIEVDDRLEDGLEHGRNENGRMSGWSTNGASKPRPAPTLVSAICQAAGA